MQLCYTPCAAVAAILLMWSTAGGLVPHYATLSLSDEQQPAHLFYIIVPDMGFADNPTEPIFAI